jgi:hypothetical protein
LLKPLLVFCTYLIMTLVSERNANFFRRKLAKIAENCDHNIDPVGHCYDFFLNRRRNDDKIDDFD